MRSYHLKFKPPQNTGTIAEDFPKSLFLELQKQCFFLNRSVQKKTILEFFFERRREAPSFFLNVLEFFFERNQPRSGWSFFLNFFLNASARSAEFFFEADSFFLNARSAEIFEGIVLF